MINVALFGNPNVGKTTVFNLLTGSNQYVGNWPGVTIDKKEGFLEKYLKFLSLGGSMDPVDELMEAGVDISKPEVIEEALNMFKETIEEFKNIYSEK